MYFSDINDLLTEYAVVVHSSAAKMQERSPALLPGDVQKRSFVLLPADIQKELIYPRSVCRVGMLRLRSADPLRMPLQPIDRPSLHTDAFDHMIIGIQDRNDAVSHFSDSLMMRAVDRKRLRIQLPDPASFLRGRAVPGILSGIPLMALL